MEHYIKQVNYIGDADLLMKVKGDIVNVGLEEIVRFYPWFKEVIDGLEKLGVHVEPYRASGLAEVEVDVSKATFEIEYVTPPPEENWEPYYELHVRVGDVVKIKVLRIDEAQVKLLLKNVELAIVNVSSKTVESLFDPFWGLRLSKGEIRFKDLEKIVKVVEYLRGKGFTLSKYSIETLAKIYEKMGAKSVKIKLKLTIINPDKVPSYNELIGFLSNILMDKGLAVEEIKGNKLHEILEKPLP